MKVIGTCGSDVVMPEIWWSVIPPTPSCLKCGASARRNLPVIPMKRPFKRPDDKVAAVAMWKRMHQPGDSEPKAAQRP